MPSRFEFLDARDGRWREFAYRWETSPFQRPEWHETICQAYGLRPRVAALVDEDGEMRAGLPVVLSRLPWRRRWTALPFTDRLEPLSTDASSAEELLRLAASQSTLPMIMRSSAEIPGWSRRLVGTSQLLEVTGGAEAVVKAAHPHHRRNVRRALRAPERLTAEAVTSAEQFLGPLIGLVARSRRRLGVPLQPRSYWRQLWRLHESQDAMSVGVFDRGRLVAAGVFLLGSDRAVYKYGASDREAWPLRPNHLMFVTAFDLVAERGKRWMDFGITDLHNRNLREFKSRWGGEEVDVYYSATDPDLLPERLEPGHLLTTVIQRMPLAFGRLVGAIGYPLTA